LRLRYETWHDRHHRDQVFEQAHKDKEALRAAIEQALKPGEPVAWMYFDSDGDAIFGHPNGYRPSDAVPVYTAPQPQPKQEPVATVTMNESMGAEFKFNRPHTLLPGEVLYVYTAPQPQPTAEKFCDTHCTWLDHHPDCKIAEDGVCEALECCKDTALLRQALVILERLEWQREDTKAAIAALRERLK
jgi:hypothetical protein